MEREIVTNGFETIDGCLHRHDISTEMIEKVLSHEKNRHLAILPPLPPAKTVIFVPAIEAKVKEVKQLWD